MELLRSARIDLPHPATEEIMELGDRVICKAAFWNAPSSAREKTIYEVIKITEPSAGDRGRACFLDLRGVNGVTKVNEPASHYEPVRHA